MFGSSKSQKQLFQEHARTHMRACVCTHTDIYTQITQTDRQTDMKMKGEEDLLGERTQSKWQRLLRDGNIGTQGKC